MSFGQRPEKCEERVKQLPGAFQIQEGSTIAVLLTLRAGQPCGRAVLYIAGFFSSFPTTTYWMLAATASHCDHLFDDQRCLQTLSYVLYGSKSLLVGNPGDRRRMKGQRQECIQLVWGTARRQAVDEIGRQRDKPHHL